MSFKSILDSAFKALSDLSFLLHVNKALQAPLPS